MNTWDEIIRQLSRGQTAAVLVSVDSIVGSTPREAGAKMIVTEDQLHGTIGGGNLEFQACRIGRDLLRSNQADRLQRFPLGAGLGQCCGGLVNLMFERLVTQQDWLKARIETSLLPVYLFGAGHVGRAVVRAMRELPLAIRWIDGRDDIFPQPAAGVEMICTDTPEAEVDAAPPQSCFLVMTHDHALDQRLCEQILQRDDFLYFGLIGSSSKRRMFETRMRRRGMDAKRFQRMTCPIGIAGISSKKPAVIAISVVAQIMQVYDQAAAGHPGLEKIMLEGTR